MKSIQRPHAVAVCILVATIVLTVLLWREEGELPGRRGALPIRITPTEQPGTTDTMVRVEAAKAGRVRSEAPQGVEEQFTLKGQVTLVGPTGQAGQRVNGTIEIAPVSAARHQPRSMKVENGILRSTDPIWKDASAVILLRAFDGDRPIWPAEAAYPISDGRVAIKCTTTDSFILHVLKPQGAPVVDVCLRARADLIGRPSRSSFGSFEYSAGRDNSTGVERGPSPVFLSEEERGVVLEVWAPGYARTFFDPRLSKRSYGEVKLSPGASWTIEIDGSAEEPLHLKLIDSLGVMEGVQRAVAPGDRIELTALAPTSYTATLLRHSQSSNRLEAIDGAIDVALTVGETTVTKLNSNATGLPAAEISGETFMRMEATRAELYAPLLTNVQPSATSGPWMNGYSSGLDEFRGGLRWGPIQVPPGRYSVRLPSGATVDETFLSGEHRHFREDLASSSTIAFDFFDATTGSPVRVTRLKNVRLNPLKPSLPSSYSVQGWRLDPDNPIRAWPGVYRIWVSAEGYMPKSFEVDVAASSEIFVEGLSPCPRLIVTILDEPSQGATKGADASHILIGAGGSEGGMVRADQFLELDYWQGEGQVGRVFEFLLPFDGEVRVEFTASGNFLVAEPVRYVQLASAVETYCQFQMLR